jgi:hypothetical protein
VPNVGRALERREVGARSATRMCAACWSRPPGKRAAGRRSATSSPAANAVRTPSSSSAPGAASNGCTPAGSGWPPAASRSRRSSSLAPASSPASSGRSRPSNRSGTPEQKGSSSGCARPHGEPSKRLCGTSPGRRPATLDRDSSRRFPVMPSRPANISLTHRRCPGRSAARAQEQNRQPEPAPLDTLLHISGSRTHPGREAARRRRFCRDERYDRLT